jgi:hypothetical protein
MPTIPITTPALPWQSAYKDITFGFDLPLVKPALASVTDEGGKARFNVNIFGTVAGCKCNRIYVPTGVYQGFHTVTNAPYSAMVGAAYFDTTTDFISDQTGDFYCMPNITYRLWYGYPDIDEPLDIKVHYRPDASMHVNLKEFLKSTFSPKILPPVPGLDVNMFRHFFVEVIGDDDFNQYLDDLGYDINYLTGYDIEDIENPNPDYVWYVINGTVPHATFNSQNVGVNKYVADVPPILFMDHCVLYTIIAGVDMDEVHNVFTCLGSAGEVGIGFMEIENDFIIG